MTVQGALRRAIFMDRDGTVCEEVGYVNHPSRCNLLARSAQAIRRVNRAGFLAIIATNQAGAARGYFDESMIGTVHERMTGMLAARGARLDAIYCCPHHPGVGPPSLWRDCDCRKPRPGLLTRAAVDHGIDLSRSYMIGDSVKDIEAAAAAGATGVMVLTGYGRGERDLRSDRWKVQPAFIAPDLFDAVSWILNGEGL